MKDKKQLKIVEPKHKERTGEKIKDYPLVSIVIPVFNGEDYLSEAIDSALAQTYPNIEVVVVNDGSTDEGKTEKIALKYGTKISYYSKENGGVATALNYGIEKMRGEYFSWLSHDDLYLPEKVAMQMKAVMNSKSHTRIVAGGYSIFVDNRNIITENDYLKLYTKEQLETPLFALLHGAVHGCALLIHKSHFDRVGTFDPQLPTTQDYDLWFRMLRGQKIIYLEGLYVLSRSHPNQDSKKIINLHIEECNRLWIHIMNSVTEYEKCLLGQDGYGFYCKIRTYLLENTFYQRAIEYADEQALKEACIEIRKKGTTKKALFWNEFHVPKEVLLAPTIQECIYYEKQKRRIVFYLGNINEMGGLNRIVLQTAASLSAFYDVYIVCFDAENGKGYPIDTNIRKIFFPMQVNYFRELAKLMQLMQVDVFIGSHNCQPDLLESYPIMEKYGVKVIAWNHEFYFVPYANIALSECLSRRNFYFRQCSAVLWLNNYSGNVYALQENNGGVMPNSLTVNVTEEQVDTWKETKSILAVGRFDDPRKGLDKLIKAYAIVRKVHPDTVLHIVGSYDLKQQIPGGDGITYERLIKMSGISRRDIVFVGWTKSVWKYYQKAYAHVLPSHHEGFGLVLIEAAAHGVPSIVFDGSGYEDIINDQKNGYIVSKDNIEEMAEKLILLFNDPTLRENMGIEAKQSINRFLPEAIIPKWKHLIDSIAIASSSEEIRNYLAEHHAPKTPQDAVVFTKQIVEEYEKTIANLVITKGDSPIGSQSTFALMRATDECEQIKRTISWRITKPLRQIRAIQLAMMRRLKKKY